MGTPAGPSPAGSNQMIQQFVSSILSQSGPSSLPYTDDSKWLIRRHLLALNSAYPSLEPRSAPFTHNDGRTLNLLHADGTIPMPFQGVTYNIPVIIWLLEPYPRYPPSVFLNPTRDMIIKRLHPHVTPSGLVSSPYLLNWIYPSSNLVDLVAELSSLFARDPPLYSQRRIPTPNPTPPPTNANPSYSSANTYHPPPARTEDAAEVFRRNAVGKIAEMVHGDVVEMRKAREVEMEGLLSAQHLLRKREELLQKGLSEMQDEMTGLESQLQLMLMNTDLLSEWIRNNQGKAMAGEGEGFDVDSAFECTDSLSKQMLECAAADLAIEDTVYSLDKAVQEGAVPFDLYLRNVRLLSREQFFHRATATKVRAVQLQAQVVNMASRVASFANS